MAKGRLRIAIEDFLNTFGFGDKIKEWIKDVAEGFEAETMQMLSPIVSKSLEAKGVPDEIRATLAGLLSGQHQAGIGTALGFATSVGSGAASSFLAPVFRMLNYWLDTVVQSARPDPALAFAMLWRNPKADTEFKHRLRELGWSNEYIEQWKEVLRPRVDLGSLVSLWLREEITKGEFMLELNHRGYETEEVIRIMRLSEAIPPAPDLIRMAVREAFTPDAIRRFGLLEDLPQEFVDWAKKIGIPEQWSAKYWIAHWQLVSPQMAFEMYHRLREGKTANPFTRADLNALLKAADIAPFLRNQLVEIAYRTYTRVDARRMYKAGVLNQDEVYDAYLDLGFPPKKAKALTDFAIKDSAGSQKDITRSAFIKSYKIGRHNKDEVIKALVAIGYDNQEANFWVDMADYEIEQDEQEEVLEGIEFEYVEGLIDKNEVMNRLGHLTIPSNQSMALLTKWDLKRLKKTRIPTRSELDSFYLDDTITEEEYKQGLTNKRYKPDTIDWYVQRIDKKKLKQASDEAERLAIEQERLIVSETKSSYREDKSSIDVEIAELNLAIAELKLMKHDITDEDILLELAERIALMRRFIADKRLEAANLKHDLERNI